MLLIHPPAVKPSEPPAGLAALSGALRAYGVSHTLLDANLEGMLWLLREGPPSPADTFTRRSRRNLLANLTFLRSPRGYADRSRYAKAVFEVNRVLERSTSGPVHLTLADYAHERLSPVASADLLHAAEHPEENPFYPYFSARLPELLGAAEGPALAGLSLNYLSQALCTFAIIGFLRRAYPRLKIVLGGGLVTSWRANPAWKDPFLGLVDQLVPGPGEMPLLALSGVAADERAFPPSFEGLPLDLYLAPRFILPFATSRGCYWRRCSFCPEKAEARAFSPRPAARAIAEVAGLSARLRPALIHLVDNALSPALMAALAATPPASPWYGFARLSPELADPDFCRTLRASGCVMLKLGLESGDQDVLDALGKGIDLAIVERALAALKQAGIATYVYLLFGTPAEDRASALTTLAFVSRINPFIDFLNLAIFNLPLNSAEAEGLERRTFYAGDLSLYSDFVHPRGWDRGKVRRFVEGEFKRDAAIRPIVLRQPPIFTSNHAPLFALSRGAGSG
jgi:hypothetical protein